jgi:hypothetical protein
MTWISSYRHEIYSILAIQGRQKAAESRPRLFQQAAVTDDRPTNMKMGHKVNLLSKCADQYIIYLFGKRIFAGSILLSKISGFLKETRNASAQIIRACTNQTRNNFNEK